MYHVSRNGQQSGPYTEEQIQSMIPDGRVLPQDLVWKQGDPDWQPASIRLSHLFGNSAPAIQNPYAPSPSSSQPAAHWQQPGQANHRPPPPDHLVWAILTTLLCCLPFGIPAIVYSAQVKSKHFAGDYAGALQSSNNAKFWCWMSFGFGFGIIVLWFVVMFTAGAAGALR
jgi:hypothetical protein